MASLGERPELKFEQEVLAWTEDVYDEADQELADSPEFRLVSRCIDYIEGRQWNAKARFGRSRPVSNRIFRQFIEMVGMLTDIQPDFKVKFYDALDGFSEIEKLMNLMIGSWAGETDFEMRLSQAVMYGLIHTGPAKVQWNPARNGGLGDVEFRHLSPLHYMEVGTDGDTQDAEMVISRQIVTQQYLLRRYGDIARGAKPDRAFSELPGREARPGRLGRESWQRLSPQLRKLMGARAAGHLSKYPRMMLKEFWFKDDTRLEGSVSRQVGKPDSNWCYWVEPGELLYPRGRVILSAGGKILEDTCNPFWHAKFPFAKYRAFRVPWKLEGQSALDPLLMMQNIINRINGGVMDTIQAAIEPTLIGPKAALSEAGWDSLDPGAPGGKIKYNNNTPRVPEFRKPPELANYVLQFEQGIEKEMDMTSGSSAIQQATSKKQVPGGDALDLIFNARSTNIRLMGRGLQSFLTEVGSLTVGTMLQFCDSRHRIAKFGARGLVANDFEPLYGNAIPQGMQPESFVQKATFSIRKGSLLSIEKAEEIQWAFALRKMKDLSRNNLFRKLDVNLDLNQNHAELKEEAAEQLAMAGAAQAMHPKGGGKK
jgi:hypothetical protein